MSVAEPEAIRSAFAARYHEVVEYLASHADPETLVAALRVADPYSGLSIALERAAAMQGVRDPLAAARARGVAARERLVHRAGGLLRVSEARERLGVSSTQAVQARRSRGTILAVPAPSGEWMYPACQFTEDGLVRGLDRFLAAFDDVSPWTQLTVLLAGSERFGGRSALELLQAGEVDAARSIAGSYGEQG